MTVSELLRRKALVFPPRVSYGDCWLYCDENGTTFSVFQHKHGKKTQVLISGATEDEAVAILIAHAEA